MQPRQLHDRRRPQSIWNRHLWLGGRRRAARRANEREGSLVDVHGPWLLLVTLAVVALNLLDAHFTLLFLSHGGEELNPLVVQLLEMGSHPWPFLLLKTVGIGAAVVVLALAKNFRPARWGLGIVLVGYLVLLGWHLHLYSLLDFVV